MTASTSIELESESVGRGAGSCRAAEPEPLLDVKTEGFESDAEALTNREVLLGFLMSEKREMAVVKGGERREIRRLGECEVGMKIFSACAMSD